MIDAVLEKIIIRSKSRIYWHIFASFILIHLKAQVKYLDKQFISSFLPSEKNVKKSFFIMLLFKLTNKFCRFFCEVINSVVNVQFLKFLPLGFLRSPYIYYRLHY